jgi:hypothetical protein
MTFLDTQSTTVEQFIPTLRDHLINMADWSVAEEQTQGDGTMRADDYVEFSTGGATSLTLQQRYRDDSNNSRTGYTWRWGKEADSDAGTYTYSPRYENPENGAGSHFFVENNNATISYTDSVTYWVFYENGRGFAFGARRDQGDGYDEGVVLAMGKVSKLWDYTNAAQFEAEYAIAGSTSASNTHFTPALPSGDSQNQPARCRINGDANFSNVPLTQDTVLFSPTYDHTVVGTTDIVVEDQRDSLAHGDVIQDSGGTDIYKVMNPTAALQHPMGIPK